MKLPPQAGLADLLRASNRLGASELAAQQGMARMLGLELASALLASPAPATPLIAPPVQTPGPPSSPADKPLPVREVSAPVCVPFKLTPEESIERKVELPAYEPLAIEAPGNRRPVTLEPLLSPSWSRSILSAISSSADDSGPIDTDRVIDTIARGRPLVTWPRRNTLTQRRGISVLVDVGDSMQPFREDQLQLIAALRKIVPEDSLRVAHFIGSPARGIRTADRPEWHRLSLDDGMAPVLLLTDLGIAQPSRGTTPAGLREWETFGRQLRRRPAVLVPYERARWPRRLQNHYQIFEWDRSTMAGTIVRQLRREGS